MASYNGAAHDKGPQSGHGVLPHGLWDAHVVLGILSLDGSRLVVGGFGIVVEVGRVLDLSDALLVVGGRVVRLGLDVFTHDC